MTEKLTEKASAKVLWEVSQKLKQDTTEPVKPDEVKVVDLISDDENCKKRKSEEETNTEKMCMMQKEEDKEEKETYCC